MGWRVKWHIPDDVSHWRVMTLHTKEPATIAWIDAMPEGSVFWDIGANIGIYSIYAASKGIEVVAVEPVPELFGTLCENIRLNGFEKRVLPIAAGLYVLPGVLLLQGRQALGLTMDGLADAIGWNRRRPTHIKIDTDGYDLAVLQGGSETLETVRSVLVEVDEDSENAPAIRSFMDVHGYTSIGRHVSPLTPNSSIGMDHFVKETT